jgi:hypothetical protein
VVEREAMSIHFKASAPFAIKVYVGGINAISGANASETLEETYRRMAVLPYQDYMVAPEQKWLDGGAVSPGLVRQFVAMPVNSQ